jgi:hypothetical protein
MSCGAAAMALRALPKSSSLVRCLLDELTELPIEVDDVTL